MLKSTVAPTQLWKTLAVTSHPIKYTKSTAMQTEPDRSAAEALEKLRDELAARIVALETQMKAKERGPPTFKGKDAETYVFRLKVWLTQNSEANPFAAMLSGFEDNEEAKTWAQNELDEDPNIMERSIEDLEKRFMTRFAPKNHDAFQPVHKKQKRAAGGAPAAGAGPSGSSAPNPTAPTRIFANHLNREGPPRRGLQEVTSAKANVVERMEADQ
ncbi:hypothetical protein PLESTB_000767300 [Pleodorina starrii]|uniref:Uncharacterized protein n=1 Tax=Pleodorina starrii TaxID=330485 RepID=A0A9W6BKS4_9CHLO|nr:hypothetical protein PLESTM_000438100 [Pleodorina starrii]GLC53600.1 hypothetical protein PLESTB_000767300 [Pleodorina starrii]GLC65704.1 hypothetical protein PLESTF_000331100 [Pleodorina starrii]